MRRWGIIVVSLVVIAGCGEDGDGGASVENDAAELIEAQAEFAEGVEVAEIGCPDDVAVEEGERFSCEADIETDVTTFAADVDYVVDEDGELVMCALRSEGDTLFEVITPPCSDG